MFIARKPALIAASLALAAGGGGVLLAATADAAVTAGSGSATVTLTTPAGKTYTRSHAVSCAADAHRYVLSVHGERGGRSVTVTLAVPEYSGPGSYEGNLVLSANGRFGSSVHHVAVPVTLTASGGSAEDSVKLPGKLDPAVAGESISADVAWTCTV